MSARSTIRRLGDARVDADHARGAVGSVHRQRACCGSPGSGGVSLFANPRPAAASTAIGRGATTTSIRSPPECGEGQRKKKLFSSWRCFRRERPGRREHHDHVWRIRSRFIEDWCGKQPCGRPGPGRRPVPRLRCAVPGEIDAGRRFVEEQTGGPRSDSPQIHRSRIPHPSTSLTGRSARDDEIEASINCPTAVEPCGARC